MKSPVNNPLTSKLTLPALGWRPHFQQQLSLQELASQQVGQITPARIVNYQRSVFTVLTAEGKRNLEILSSMPSMTVGDWLLLNSQGQFHRLLDRASLFSRQLEGPRETTQLIAANIDTVFVVSSLNLDFNLSRIERYLTLAHESRVKAVVVLSKSDLCDDVEERIAQVQALDPTLSVIALNSLDPISAEQLQPWCGVGQTTALLGSSGVGKSTLVNTLMTEQVQRTGAIRELDSKGRHTTSGRSLHLLPSGGLLLDTPGIRELQVGSSDRGVDTTFADIIELAAGCRFGDCKHINEPGCAVKAAVEAGGLDARRLSNFHKLLLEQIPVYTSRAARRAENKKTSRPRRPGKKPE